MSPLEIIFASIGGSAALVLALGWLAKSFVSNLLDKDIAKYKIALEAQKEVNIASFRHELEKLALEHNVRFSTLHERRDVVIATLYSEIVDFYHAVEHFIDINVPGVQVEPMKLGEENERLWKAVDSFKDYAEKHRIYFSASLCKKLDKLSDTTDGPTSQLMESIENPNAHAENGYIFDIWRAAKDNIQTNVKVIRDEIENDFRQLLGVAESASGT